MPELQPLILVNPVLTIDGVPLECLMSHVELVPDVTVIEITTSCGVKEYPGAVKWTLKATLYHSHDPAGTNETLTAAVEGGVPVPFTVVPSSDPVSATNPEYTGEVIPKPFAPISGDVGAESSLDLEWSIQGWGNTPTTNITPVVAAAAADSDELEPEPVNA
jgi:hypothetical protein